MHDLWKFCVAVCGDEGVRHCYGVEYGSVIRVYMWPMLCIMCIADSEDIFWSRRCVPSLRLLVK